MKDESSIIPEKLQLQSVRPQYDETEHKPYVERIKAAIDDFSANKALNIALAGPYGSGKSSVLEAIKDAYPSKSVRISLSTLSPLAKEASAADLNKELNAIQKEVVKQLLYVEKASRVSSFRFRRIETFRSQRAALVSALIAGAILMLSFASGAAKPFIKLSGAAPGWLYLAWPVAFALFFGAAWFLQKSFHNRFRIEAITAGPATISANDTQSGQESVFDRYLDEIVYFFAASKRNIVIFEDLDRFETVGIFEELRELNVILNNAGQIDAPVRFIYAIRDSVFDEIGSEEQHASGRRISSASARAKFFDLVIPVVPFATSRTALDLWIRKSHDLKLPTRLLGIAARHIQDMRVITNVRNEYLVFLEVITGNTISGLDLRPEELFALMLYKATELEDFEKIKDGTSALDSLERVRRDLIAAEIRALDEREARLLSGQLATSAKVSAATRLGGMLNDNIKLSLQLAMRPSLFSYELDGVAATEADAQTAEFWSTLVRVGALTLISSAGRYVLSGDELMRAATNEALEFDWAAVPNTQLDAELALIGSRRNEVRISEICELSRKGISLDSLRVLMAEHTTPERPTSELLLDLALAGFIDRNFSLYVSRFYGESVSAEAMNFVLHTIQTGSVDIDASLPTPNDAEGVVLEAGYEFLATASGFNIDLVDHLSSREELDPLFLTMAEMNPSAARFLAAYIARGKHLAEFFGRLTAVWPGALSSANTTLGQDREKGLVMLESAIASMTAGLTYDRDFELASVFDALVAELPVLQTLQAEHTKALVSFLGASGYYSNDVTKLGGALEAELLSNGRFNVNEVNLKALAGDNQWSLDTIAAPDSAAFARLIGNWQNYLKELPSKVPTIGPHGNLEVVISAMNDAPDEVVRAFLLRSATGLKIASIQKLPAERWPIVLQTFVTPSAENLTAYFAKRGLDAVLGALIAGSVTAVEAKMVPVSERMKLGIAVMKSQIAASKRTRFVESLDIPAPIDMSGVGNDGSALFGYMLRSRLIEDTAATFDQLGGGPWPAREIYIKHARAFESYALVAKWSSSELEKLFDGPTRASVKTVLWENFSLLGPEATAAVATACARWVLREGQAITLPKAMALCVGQAAAVQVIDILVRWKWLDPQLLSMLSFASGDLSDLATKSRARPVIPRSSNAEILLSRLKAMGYVSSWKNHSDGKHLVVYLRRP